MVVQNPGMVQPGEPVGKLHEALGGREIRQAQSPGTQAPTAGAAREVGDQVTLADQLAVTLRSTNTDFQRVQERILSNEVALKALDDIRDEIASLRTALRPAGQEPMNLDLISQTIGNINKLVQDARFNNVPLLDDFNAEALGMTRMEPDMPRLQLGQVLNRAMAQVEDRMDEVREEDAIDRRQLRTLEVGLENVTAALNAERIDNMQAAQENMRAVQQNIPRGGGAVNLTPDQVLELI